MKKAAIIILLTTFSILSFAQNKYKIEEVIISYSGDSTLLTESYQINIEKKKIYYLTPIMNYLDIKGVKYRTRIRKKQNWTEIISLINKLTVLTLDPNNKMQNSKFIYTIEFIRAGQELEKYQFYANNVPNELQKLFTEIRNKK